MSERIVVGVDIGTTKVCAIVASHAPGGDVHVLGVGTAPNDGLNRGVVVNIDKTVAAVQKAIYEAERMAGVEVRRVVVGIAGDHIESRQSRGIITINNRSGEITQADVQRLIEDTRQVDVPSDRTILHVIPQEFVVDGQDGVFDPVGMSGKRLEAKVHIITGLISATRNIHRCIEKAGYEVADIVLEPLASSYAVLHPDEKEVGVAIIDIGGGTTDIAVFEENTIRHTAVIAIAGNKVTDDIRRGLGVMREQAEALKQQFGVTLVDMADENEEITIPGIGGRPDKAIGRSVLAQIVQPRMEEILEFAAVEIRRTNYGQHLSGGVVLSGGGALIPGTAELAADILGVETRIGRPLGLEGALYDQVDDPKFATSVGLVLYAIRPEVLGGAPAADAMGVRPGATAPAPPPPAPAKEPNRLFSSVKKFFDEL
jgi:cell division protein FtsA